MVITVRGTDHNSNKAAHATALLAGYNAVKYKRRTLVLQLSHKVSISDILVGNKKQLELDGGAYSYDDSGIDSLIRVSEQSGVRKEEFDTYCLPVIESAPNLLDIAKETNVSNFEETLLQKEDVLVNIIDQAGRIYDDIFLYVNGGNRELLEMVNRHTDKEIVCVRQGNKQPLSEVPEDSIYVITAYDDDSSINVKLVRKMYEVKRVSYIPYNVQVKDAYNNGTLMSFISSNIKLHEDDRNFDLERSIDIILEQVNNGVLELKETTEGFDEYIEKKQKELGVAAIPDVKFVTEKKPFRKEKEVVKRVSSEPLKVIPSITGEALIEEHKEEEPAIEEDIWEEVKEPVKKEKKGLFGKKKKDEALEELVPDEFLDDDDEEINLPEEEIEEESKVKPEPAPKKVKKVEKPAKEEVKPEVVKKAKSSKPTKVVEEEEQEQEIEEEIEPEVEETDEFVNPEVADEAEDQPEDIEEEPEEEAPEVEIPKMQAPQKKDTVYVCICGEIFDSDYKFCPMCGKKKTNNWFCICGNENMERAKFCTECGKPKEA